MNPFRNIFHSSAIVDFGSGWTKTDYSGEETPKFVFRSVLAKPKYKKILASAPENSIVSPETEKMGLYRITPCIKRGIFQTEEDMRSMISKIYSDLGISNAKEVPLLFSEPLFAPKSQKRRLMKVCFESYESQSILFANQCSLALFAFGKTDGIVLESGDGLTQVASIFNGSKIDDACHRVSLGGSDVSALLKTLLAKNDISLHPSSEAFVLNDIKIRLCNVPKCPNEYLQSDQNLSVEPHSCQPEYTLPDGQIIKLSAKQTMCGEVLFTPTVGHLEGSGISELFKQTLQGLDLEIKNHLIKHLHVSGGNTQIKGFDDRLLSELAKDCDYSIKRKLVVGNVDRGMNVWQGGSVLTSLSSIGKMWITAKDYEENGDRIFLIKVI